MVIMTWLPGKLLLGANVCYGVPAQDGITTPEGLNSGSRGDDSVPASIQLASLLWWGFNPAVGQRLGVQLASNWGNRYDNRMLTFSEGHSSQFY